MKTIELNEDEVNYVLKYIIGDADFWKVNKDIAKKLKSNDAALLLADLSSKQSYFKKRNMLTEDGFFFNTSEELEEDTNLTYHKQKKCIKLLEKNGLLQTKLKGVPAKIHFKISNIQILNFSKTSIEKSEELDFEKFENINKNKEIRIKNNINKEEILKFENPLSMKSYIQNEFSNREKYERLIKPVLDSFCAYNGYEWEGKKEELWRYLLSVSPKIKAKSYTGVSSDLSDSIENILYHYKVNGSTKKHNDKSRYERDKKHYADFFEDFTNKIV